MKAKVIVQAQYFENYSDDSAFPYWKAKGCVPFEIEIDSDLLFYGPVAEPIFSKLLEKHNNNFCKYKYASHEVLLQPPALLGTEEDYLSYIEKIN